MHHCKKRSPRPRSLHDWSWFSRGVVLVLTAILLATLQMIANPEVALAAPSVKTDKPDYSPGETVKITEISGKEAPRL